MIRRLVKPVARVVTRPVGSVRAVRGPDPAVVLTYDDGPDPEGTPRVLDALAARGATATFFVLVDHAREHRHLLDRITTAGHELALHGLDHRRLTALPAAEVRRRTARGKAELEDLAGVRVSWFRPPYGAQTPATWLAVRSCGLQPVVWGPTAWDWLDLPVEELADKALQGLHAGSVLLAHDGFAVDPHDPNPLPRPGFDRGKLTMAVLDALADRGWRGRSLSAALRTTTPDSWAWFRR